MVVALVAFVAIVGLDLPAAARKRRGRRPVVEGRRAVGPFCRKWTVRASRLVQKRLNGLS